MPADLPSIRARLAAAPTFDQMFDLRARIFMGPTSHRGTVFHVGIHDLERLFAFAHAPSDLAELVDEVEALRAEVAEMTAYADRVCGCELEMRDLVRRHCAACGGRLE